METKKVIISLTSYPARIKYAQQTIETLLNQTKKADMVILWLADSQFPERVLPEGLKALTEKGLTIEWCEDLKSYKKLIPALKKYPDYLIVTADDDILYQKDWLEKLYNAYLENPDMINTHRAHRVMLDENNKVLPYKKWCYCLSKAEPSFNNFLTTGGGVIFPPNSFYKDVLNEELFRKLCPSADDIWFWAMCVLNGKKINVIPDNYAYIDCVEGSQEAENLNDINVEQNKNDEQLKKVFEYYPELNEKLDKSPFKDPNEPTITERIFSVKHKGKKKIIRVLGFKFTIKNKKG